MYAHILLSVCVPSFHRQIRTFCAGQIVRVSEDLEMVERLMKHPEDWAASTRQVGIPKRLHLFIFKVTSRLPIQCGLGIWKETIQLASGKVDFNACQVSLLWHNFFLVSLWTLKAHPRKVASYSIRSRKGICKHHCILTLKYEAPFNQCGIE